MSQTPAIHTLNTKTETNAVSKGFHLTVNYFQECRQDIVLSNQEV
jgi:hypothetical protein